MDDKESGQIKADLQKAKEQNDKQQKENLQSQNEIAKKRAIDESENLNTQYSNGLQKSSKSSKLADSAPKPSAAAESLFRSKA